LIGVDQTTVEHETRPLCCRFQKMNPCEATAKQYKTVAGLTISMVLGLMNLHEKCEWKFISKSKLVN
jgi:hypothetical protein